MNQNEPPTSIDLAGPWALRPDPEDGGVAKGWFRAPANWTDVQTTSVPSAWQHTLGPDYRGIAWYARTIRLPASWGVDHRNRLRLRFDSVATDATVWVNGAEVGRHSGDFVPFEFDITDAAASSREVSICVRVDEVYAGRPPAGELTERGHITKGFHDVLSLQHGGIWGDVALRLTGKPALLPDGVRVLADPGSGRIRIRVEADGDLRDQQIQLIVMDPQGECRYSVSIRCSGDTPVSTYESWLRPRSDGQPGWRPEDPAAVDLVTQPAPPERFWQLWAPDSPKLYTLWAAVMPLGSDTEPAFHEVRFAFRTVTTGGPDNRHILLNNRPVLLRGVLHWGHEPDHIAPAPTPDQVRAEFARLKELGFNCVCLCMWYPPRHFFDIADEMGMLIWQEHPVWKSPMEEELIPEYQRMFEKFFRRDRNHPSVIIVSGSCEHERIHPDLAAWWWKRAKEENPDRLCQIQTAFIGWTNPDQTDLHDEHVYESSGRWARFCDDLQATLAELPPKPFVMGETIIGTSWVDVGAFREAEEKKLWWRPKGLPECEAFERSLAERWGDATLQRFKAAADRLNLEQRKFQSEVLRMVPRHAGWVMNQIRDVPPGRLGFMDDLGRWRFSPDQTRPWLSDQILLLRTPDHRRGFIGGQGIPAEIGVSNFGGTPFESTVEVRLSWDGQARTLHTAPIRAGLGEIGWSAPLALPLPAVERPTRVQVQAIAPQVFPNAWDLWAFPAAGDVPDGVVRLDGLPYSKKDLEPEFEERAYSSGWGLKVRTWKVMLPHPEAVVFKAPLWRFDAPMPSGTRIVVTHKLTRAVVDFMDRGGRVVLLANRSPGGLGTKFVTLWGQVPLVIEEGPLASGDGAWISDLLHYDLTRRYTRAIPVEEMGIADRVDPLVRLVFTHDRGVPRLMDAAFAVRVGSGVLLATSLDHTEDAGRWMIQRFLEWLSANEEPRIRGALDVGAVRAWVVM